nr:substrate-binding domain-containing protein [Kribbella shirazensis]
MLQATTRPPRAARWAGGAGGEETVSARGAGSAGGRPLLDADPRTGGANAESRTGGANAEPRAGGVGGRPLPGGAAGGAMRPDGLVCANDELALAALTTFVANGVRVPDDIVVTGWDDVMAARYVSPGLTTVRQPMAELGRVAAERLHERVTGARTRARNDVLETQLVLRDSCGTNPGDAQQ